MGHLKDAADNREENAADLGKLFPERNPSNLPNTDNTYLHKLIVPFSA